MEQTILTGNAGGAHVVGAPVTTTVTRNASPELLLSEIDSRIVKIRPMMTPIDQISRLANSRQSKSMKTEYYSVDTPPTSTKVSKEVLGGGYSDSFTVKVDNPSIFSPSDTVLCPDATVDEVPKSVMFYVENTGTDLTLRLICDDPKGSDFPLVMLKQEARLIRMGRAAAELDVQTTHSQALPVKRHNYCQIFKAQVEQSMLQRLSAKEVGWTLLDQEEVALIDMRLGMEKSFLFGQMHRFDKGTAGEVFMTQGIWNQTDHDFFYDPEAFSAKTLVELSRMAFTGNAGSARKVLVAGSGLIEALSKLDIRKTAGATDTVTRWGIDFTEIHTKFGRLYVVLSEVFDDCGHENEGMVIDPEYLQKYTHIPFKAMPIDLSASGQRNCEAVVLTEASCLVLRYPSAHMRIRVKLSDKLDSDNGNSGTTPGGNQGGNQGGSEGENPGNQGENPGGDGNGDNFETEKD